MITPDQIPASVAQCIDLFSDSEQVKLNPKLLGNLKTVIKKFVLPGFGYKEIDHSQLDKILASLTVKQFQDAKLYFMQTAIERLEEGISQGTFANYKSVLNRFLQWMTAQDWYEDASGVNDGKYAPRLRAKTGVAKVTKGRRSYRNFVYGLQEAELTPKLLEQLDKFKYFLMAPEVPKRQDPPLRLVSYARYHQIALNFWGWLIHTEEWSMDDLDLSLLIDIDLLEEFIAWGINTRGNTYAWAHLAGCLALNVAKWLHYKSSKKSKYRDIEAVETIRNKVHEISLKRRKEPSRLRLEERLISLEQCIKVEKYLKLCCAPARAKVTGGSKRPDHAILASWQKYLIIAILTYCPVRQRELRELELGKTLFREPDGYLVKLSLNDHKTGSKTGKGREYRLPAHLTQDIDEWLTVWRPKIPTEHQFVFVHCSYNVRFVHNVGRPFTVSEFAALVRRTMVGATTFLFGTPKLTTPHDFRRIGITWQRKYGNREQNEAFAELLGHSVDAADQIYSQLTSREKTEKATDWWKPVASS